MSHPRKPRCPTCKQILPPNFNPQARRQEKARRALAADLERWRTGRGPKIGRQLAYLLRMADKAAPSIHPPWTARGLSRFGPIEVKQFADDTREVIVIGTNPPLGIRQTPQGPAWEA